jgi:hypothetical protein
LRNKSPPPPLLLLFCWNFVVLWSKTEAATNLNPTPNQTQEATTLLKFLPFSRASNLIFNNEKKMTLLQGIC